MCKIRQHPTSQIRLETKTQYLFKYSTFPTDLLKVQKNNVNKNSILLICNIVTITLCVMLQSWF